MKKRFLVLSSLLISLQGMAIEVNNLQDWVNKGSAHGNIKYYFIETNKDNSATNLSTSAYAHSVGGKLNYTTADFNGFSAGVTFMTTNPFALPSRVDTSIIGRDNGVRIENSAGSGTAKKGFAVLGESFINYKNKNFESWYGRRVIRTPFVDAKEVRMIPSAVEGGSVAYTFDNGINVGVSYLNRFKQRTSNKFVNIMEHALGSNTKAITGKSSGYVIPVDIMWSDKNNKARIYNYYARDFMNSIYADFEHKFNTNNDFKYTMALQGIHQNSIGHSRGAMNNNIASYGGKIDSSEFGIKGGVSYKESVLKLAYTNVLNSSYGEHNSLVMPWDGTPLFTDTITSNDLFTSNYGKGLTSAAGYIADTQGVKLTYVQKYNFMDIKGIKSVLAYARFNNSAFDNTQQDINAVLSYSKEAFSLSLKGIWTKNNTSNGASDNKSSISQIDRLVQYRVIADYTF